MKLAAFCLNWTLCLIGLGALSSVSCQREPTLHPPAAGPEELIASPPQVAQSSAASAEVAPEEKSAANVSASVSQPAAAAGPALRTVLFSGACDASGAVPLDDHSLAVADDEDNILRLYDAEKGGEPLRTLNLSPQLDLRKKHPESDIEAATLLGNEAYWLTSHGRNRKGKLKPERLFFFGTSLPSLDGPLQFIGEPYRSLHEDLIRQPQLAALGLAAASLLAPKAPGGLNIEGLSATPDGSVLLGFRSPIPEGLALLVPLKNPRAVLWGAKPEFLDPVRLDLGGLGVRSLSWWRGQYLISAGPPAEGSSRLFTWQGPGSAARAVDVDLSAFNPEGFFTPEDRDEVLLLSDDGTQLVAGTECKSLKDPQQKRFRGVWVRPF